MKDGPAYESMVHECLYMNVLCVCVFEFHKQPHFSKQRALSYQHVSYFFNPLQHYAVKQITSELYRETASIRTHRLHPKTW